MFGGFGLDVLFEVSFYILYKNECTKDILSNPEKDPNQEQALAALEALVDAFTYPTATRFLAVFEHADADPSVGTMAEAELTAAEIPTLAMAYMHAGRLLVGHVRDAVVSGLLVAQPTESIIDRSESMVHFISTLALAPPAPLPNGFNLQILLESADTSFNDELGHPDEHNLIVRDGNVGQLRVTTIDTVFSTVDGGQRKDVQRDSTLEVTNEVRFSGGSIVAHAGVTVEESRYDEYPESRIYGDGVSFEAANAIRGRSDYADFGFGKRETLALAAFRHAVLRCHRVSHYLVWLMDQG